MALWKHASGLSWILLVASASCFTGPRAHPSSDQRAPALSRVKIGDNIS